MTPAVQQKLLELHPQARLSPPPKASLPRCRVQCEASQVRAATLSFPTASAPGPSGLRAEHLRACITSAPTSAASRFLDAVTVLFNRCLSSALSESFTDLFLSARLLPFKRKDDGVRPTAIDEVRRRLVAKVALKQVLPQAQGLLRTTQIGVGAKDAVTHIAAEVRCAHDVFGRPRLRYHPHLRPSQRAQMADHLLHWAMWAQGDTLRR